MRAEIDDVGSLAELASPDVVVARIDRLGADVSARDLTERRLKNTGAPDVIAGPGSGSLAGTPKAGKEQWQAPFRRRGGYTGDIEHIFE
ncbi:MULTISPECIES: hypothetical protein [unclassified Arthrobacter]|uniref:hypothetical protein n=1 Tax=unclassified Arthrobacter TaxID=235627 RepID=UPI002E155DFF|nr:MULTISPECIES: hypothetical protein [unclassified Arthrobacter]